jgi:ketosteroid isomerase-like protein
MSLQNVEIVRDAYEPVARGDFTWAAKAVLADDFEFVTSPELPDAGLRE